MTRNNILISVKINGIEYVKGLFDRSGQYNLLVSILYEACCKRGLERKANSIMETYISYEDKYSRLLEELRQYGGDVAIVESNIED